MAFFLFINKLSDSIATLFSGFSGIQGLYITSTFSALIILFLLKKTSNQQKIKIAKKRIFGYFLELGLFKDQFKRSMGSQLNIFKNNLLYLKHFLIPMVIISIPVVLISMQLDFRLGIREFKEKENFIINVVLDKDTIPGNALILDKIKIESSPNISLDSEAVRIFSDLSIAWRGSIIKNDGPQFIKISIEGTNQTITKLISPNKNGGRYSSLKKKYESINDIMYLGDDFIKKDSYFYSVSVNNYDKVYSFFGYEISPLLYFFILTMIVGFLVKPFLGVSV